MSASINLQSTHHFYGNARFNINVESGKINEWHAKLEVEPIFMSSFTPSSNIFTNKSLLKLSYKKVGIIGGQVHNSGENSVLSGIEYNRDYISIIIYNQFNKDELFQSSIMCRFKPPSRPYKRRLGRYIPIRTL